MDPKQELIEGYNCIKLEKGLFTFGKDGVRGERYLPEHMKKEIGIIYPKINPSGLVKAQYSDGKITVIDSYNNKVILPSNDRDFNTETMFPEYFYSLGGTVPKPKFLKKHPYLKKFLGLLGISLALSTTLGCINPEPTPTTPPKTTSEPTDTPTYTPPPTTSEPTLPPTTTPAQVDKELELAQTLGLSGPATDYARGLDEDLEVNNNEGELGKAFDKLYKEKGIQPSTTEDILDIVYEGGMIDLEYLMEHVIDSNVFNEMIKNEFELYEKDLFGTMIEKKDPFIISQYDTDPAEKLEIYEGIYDKPMNTKNAAEIPFFRNLKEKMFDKYNGGRLGCFRKDRDDGNWYWNLSDLVSVGKGGNIYILYPTHVAKYNRDIYNEWNDALGKFYDKYNDGPETHMDKDIKEFIEKNDLLGKELDLPFYPKKYIVVPRIYEDNEKKNKWDIYSKHFALGIPEIENTGRYQKYEFCVPYNPRDTIISAAQGKVSNIDSYIYIYRPVGAPLGNWSNLVFKDNEYIPVIKHTFVPMEYKVSALAAIYWGLENFNEILDTGEKIKYIIG